MESGKWKIKTQTILRLESKFMMKCAITFHFPLSTFHFYTL